MRSQDSRYAKVTLSVALAATLAGVGVAAPVAETASRLLTGRDVKNSSVTSKDVRNGSLRRVDLAPGVRLKGVAGPTGAPGVAGSPGPTGAVGGTGGPGDPGLPGGVGPTGGTDLFTDGSGGTP